MKSRLAVREIIILSGESALCLALALIVCAAAAMAQAQPPHVMPIPSFGGKTVLSPYADSRPRSSSGPRSISNAATESYGAYLHFFVGYPDDGQFPLGGLVEDSSGNFYGTTQAGGASNLGTVYEVSATGTYSILYCFSGPDGQSPSSSMIIDSSGNLYGTTYAGGADNLGVVFKVSPPVTGSDVWTEAVLYSFSGTPDGAHPIAGLVMGSGGYLYGVTSFGGTDNFGTVFKLNSNGVGNETVLHNFVGGKDGAYPLASLLLDPGGNLYGVTAAGGTHGLGTAFWIKPNGKESVLHSFKGGNDGAAPYYSALIRDSAGNLYGTTYYGGREENPMYDAGGTIFELPVTGGEKVLYFFCGLTTILGPCTDGDNPSGGMIQGANGEFYGMAQYGGAGLGVFYSFNPVNYVEDQLYYWNFYASQPIGSLIQDKSGAFYGTTYSGGITGESYDAYGFGSVFTFTPLPWRQ